MKTKRGYSSTAMRNFSSPFNNPRPSVKSAYRPLVSFPDIMDFMNMPVIQVDESRNGGIGVPVPESGQSLLAKNLGIWQTSYRGGEIHVRVAGDRIVLSGRAITVMRGIMPA